MSTNPAPPNDQVEQARRQINRIAEDIAQLSEKELAPPEYYGEFLHGVLLALQGGAGAVWLKTSGNSIELQAHINFLSLAIDRDPVGKGMHDQLLHQAMQRTQGGIVAPQTNRGSGSAPDQQAGNPTEYAIFFAPIVYEKQVIGLIEVFQEPNRPQQAHQGYLQFMMRMASLASAYTRNHQMRQMAGQQQVWLNLENFSRLIHGSLDPTRVAYHIANESRRLIECDRVSVAVRTGGSAEVKAISGADVVEKRSNLVSLMRALFDAVLDWGEKLVFTGKKDESLPPAVLHALDAYLGESNSKLVVVQPLKDERDEDAHKKPRSALMMECFEPKATPEILIGKLDVVSRHCCTALYNSAEHHRIPMRFLWMPLAYLQDGLGGKAKAITTAVLVGVAALVLALVYIPYPLRIDSKGNVMPKSHGWVYAPTQGHIREIKPNLVSGSVVFAGQELMTLEDLELGKQITDLSHEISVLDQTSRQILPTNQQSDPSQVAKIEEAKITVQAKRQQLDKLVRRTNSELDSPGRFKIKAPFTGVVLNTNFRENLQGRFVKPNEQLIHIGAVDLKNPRLSEWEVELKIPQKHVGHILEAFNKLGPNEELDIDLLLMSRTQSVYRGKLRRDRISAQATQNRDDNNEPEPVVMAWARVVGDDIPEAERVPLSLLLSGTEVHSRVRCGTRAMGYSLFYGVYEFLYKKVVFFF